MFTAAAVIDFVATKLVMDASSRVSQPQQLAFVLCFVLIGTFVTLVGLSYQVEQRNRLDRILYLTLENRARAVLEGGDPAQVPDHAETRWRSVQQSWGATWPLLAMAGLTAALCWFASVIGNPAPTKPTAQKTCITEPSKQQPPTIQPSQSKPAGPSSPDK